jgi:protein-L-isoaspartate(D-aspartate) O-methyltransferase
MNVGLERREISLVGHGESPKQIPQDVAQESVASDYAAFRQQMVERQLRARGIRDERVLNAMLTVPREEFVPGEMRDLAYTDRPISIGEDQTISQPYMVASMAEALKLSGKENVLEIGTGSGYAAAILSRIAKFVHTLESRPALATAAAERLTRLGFASVSVHTSDGSMGFSEAAPYDAIVVAAAAPSVPQPLVDQLAEGGRLVIPIGRGELQDLTLVQRSDGAIHSTVLFQCRFVPLTGRHGFPA